MKLAPAGAGARGERVGERQQMLGEHLIDEHVGGSPAVR